MILRELVIDGKTVVIEERNRPDAEVQDWLKTLDETAKRFYRHESKQSNEIQWFALHDGRIVGMGFLADRFSDVVTFGCVIHQEFRGKGLGKVMYALATEIAIRHDKSAITGEQDADNYAAHALCRRERFEFYGPIYQLRKELK